MKNEEIIKCLYDIRKNVEYGSSKASTILNLNNLINKVKEKLIKEDPNPKKWMVELDMGPCMINICSDERSKSLDCGCRKTQAINEDPKYFPCDFHKAQDEERKESISSSVGMRPNPFYKVYDEFVKDKSKIRFRWAGNTYEIERGFYGITRLFNDDDLLYSKKLKGVFSLDEYKKNGFLPEDEYQQINDQLRPGDRFGDHFKIIEWFCEETALGVKRTCFIGDIKCVPDIL